MVWEMTILFQGCILRCPAVNLPGCKSKLTAFFSTGTTSRKCYSSWVFWAPQKILHQTKNSPNKFTASPRSRDSGSPKTRPSGDPRIKQGRVREWCFLGFSGFLFLDFWIFGIFYFGDFLVFWCSYLFQECFLESSPNIIHGFFIKIPFGVRGIGFRDTNFKCQLIIIGSWFGVEISQLQVLRLPLCLGLVAPTTWGGWTQSFWAMQSQDLEAGPPIQQTWKHMKPSKHRSE